MVIKTSKKSFPKVGFYDIGEVIGEGNFATVRHARHRNTNSDVSYFILWCLFFIDSASHCMGNTIK